MTAGLLLPPVGAVAVPDHGFPDVGRDSAFASEISWLVEREITTGRADGSFGPGLAVTRGQMAAFLFRLAGSPDEDAPAPDFTDIDDDNPFAEEIAWVAANDITVGRDDGTFGWRDDVTRGQMAAFLVRLSAVIDPDHVGLAMGWPAGLGDDDLLARYPIPLPVPSQYLGVVEYDTPTGWNMPTVGGEQLQITADVSVDQVADWWLGTSGDGADEGPVICDADDPDCVPDHRSAERPDDLRELHALTGPGALGDGPVTAYVIWIEPHPEEGVMATVFGYAG